MQILPTKQNLGIAIMRAVVDHLPGNYTRVAAGAIAKKILSFDGVLIRAYVERFTIFNLLHTKFLHLMKLSHLPPAVHTQKLP